MKNGYGGVRDWKEMRDEEGEGIYSNEDIESFVKMAREFACVLYTELSWRELCADSFHASC